MVSRPGLRKAMSDGRMRASMRRESSRGMISTRFIPERATWPMVVTITLMTVFVINQSLIAADTGRVFVTNERSNDITVIDSKTLEIETTIAIGKRPRGIGLSPDRKELYVAISDENQIAVLDPESLRVLRKFQSGSDPETFAVHPNGNIYISNVTSWPYLNKSLFSQRIIYTVIEK